MNVDVPIAFAAAFTPQNPIRVGGAVDDDGPHFRAEAGGWATALHPDTPPSSMRSQLVTQRRREEPGIGYDSTSAVNPSASTTTYA
jgi:hypothetical protein